jgi:hypothetical protein
MHSKNLLWLEERYQRGGDNRVLRAKQGWQVVCLLWGLKDLREDGGKTTSLIRTAKN